MNSVAVMWAARAVRDELDSLVGDASEELRDRLDPLLAETDGLAGQPAEAVIMLIAQYGPAWDRFTFLLSLHEGPTAEQVIRLLSPHPGDEAGPVGLPGEVTGSIPLFRGPANLGGPTGGPIGGTVHGWSPDEALSAAPGRLPADRDGPGQDRPVPEDPGPAAYDRDPGGMPSTGAMDLGWMRPGPPAATPAPAGGRGSSVLDRLTGALRRRRARAPVSAPEGGWEAVPLIEAPAEVVAGWGAEVSVGVAPGQGRDGTTPPAGPFELDVQLVAEGFEAPGGWRVRLRADDTSPHPRATLGLIALSQEEPEVTRQIQTIHSVGGEVVGFGVRSITVLGSPGSLGREEAAEPVAGTGIGPAPVGEPADVTAIIVHGDEPGRLWWSYRSPHFVTPDRAELCDLGTRASEFGRTLTGQGHLSEELGRKVGSRVPRGFWELLNAVAARVAPRRPSVLILSQESHVPWELAVLEHPYDPSLPRYLNCQTVTGHWPLGGRRPGLPPPAYARADRVAVVCEGEHPLMAEYGAARVPPALGDVLDLLGRGADVVHLTAGVFVSEALGREAAGAPFVFLEEPGDAQAFLLAGASGVVAPLWPGGAGLAREFHRRCLAGEPVAEVLRSIRARDPLGAGGYRFHGHPSLTLRRTVPPPG